MSTRTNKQTKPINTAGIMTRFDQDEFWLSANGQVSKLKELETDHLMNIIKLMTHRPVKALSACVSDLESKTFGWPKLRDSKQYAAQLTALSPEEFIDYIVESPLIRAMKAELMSRGVNPKLFQALCDLEQN